MLILNASNSYNPCVCFVYLLTAFMFIFWPFSLHNFFWLLPVHVQLKDLPACVRIYRFVAPSFWDFLKYVLWIGERFVFLVNFPILHSQLSKRRSHCRLSLCSRLRKILCLTIALITPLPHSKSSLLSHRVSVGKSLWGLWIYVSRWY